MKTFKFESGRVSLLLVLLLVFVSVCFFALDIAPVKAWESCPIEYQFQVLVGGSVQVKNDSNSDETSQMAKVYIDSFYVQPDLSVPAMNKNTSWTTFGNVPVPAAVYTWSVVGQADTKCQNSGTNDNSPTPIPSATPTPTPIDVCPNLDGIQTSIPDGYHFDNDHVNCLQYQFGGPPSPPPANKQIPGVSTTQSQVLGTSTMAGTGSFEENIYMSIMEVGGIITAFGFKNIKKVFKVAK